MSLTDTIKEDMKTAMKAKEPEKVMVLRGIMSAFTNELVAQKKMPQDLLDDQSALAVITREAKRRKDSIAQFTEGGRADLAEAEQVELAILETYLPTLMSLDEIRQIAEAKKAELGVVDKTEMGKFMGVLMKELQGKADGGDVKTVVDSLF